MRKAYPLYPRMSSCFGTNVPLYGLCFRVIDDEGIFVRVKPEVNGHGATARFKTGEHGFQGLRIIVLQERYTISLLNTESIKGIGQSVYTRIKLSVGQPFGAMHHREVVWKSPCRLCEKLTDIRGFILSFLWTHSCPHLTTIRVQYSAGSEMGGMRSERVDSLRCITRM